jgi:7-cyano-7-deazaguanine synthase
MTPNPSDTAAVVLISGGMDSTVLLHHVANDLDRKPIRAISFNYGQRHVRELECAARQAALAGAEHRVIDVRFFASLVSAGTSLVEGGDAVPDLADLRDDQLAQPPTYVPNRNMMLLSIAAAYAEAQGVTDIFYGAQAHDEYGYWDCTADFLDRINRVLALNRATPVVVHAPLIGKRKSELVGMGQRLGVNFADTWSCYRGGDIACGTCPTCVERLKAFAESGQEDPLRYLSTT